MFKILPKHIHFYNKNGFLVCKKSFNNLNQNNMNKCLFLITKGINKRAS